jgi:hypothetical protein
MAAGHSSSRGFRVGWSLALASRGRGVGWLDFRSATVPEACCNTRLLLGRSALRSVESRCWLVDRHRITAGWSGACCLSGEARRRQQQQQLTPRCTLLQDRLQSSWAHGGPPLNPFRHWLHPRRPGPCSYSGTTQHRDTIPSTLIQLVHSKNCMKHHRPVFPWEV